MRSRKLRQGQKNRPTPSRYRKVLLAALGFAGGLGIAAGIILLWLRPPAEARMPPLDRPPADLVDDPDLVRGFSALDFGDSQAALESFRAAASRHPDRPEPRIQQARVHRAWKENARALELLDEARALAPDNAAVYYLLGECLDDLGRRDEAAADFLEASRLAPGDPRPYFRLGRIADMKQQNDVAVSRYREALDRDPAFSAAAHYLAIQLKNSSRYEEAVRLLESVLEREPGNPSVRCNLAHLCLGMGEAARAAKEFERAIPLLGQVPGSNDQPEAYYYLGRALELDGKLEKARGAYRTALEWDPVLHRAWYSLSQVEKALGDDDDAEGSLREFERARKLKTRLNGATEAFEKNPRSLPALIEYANMLIDAGRPQEAQGLLERVLASSGEHPQIVAILSRATSEAERKEERLRKLR